MCTENSEARGSEYYELNTDMSEHFSWRHIRSILLLPATVTILIPMIILAQNQPLRLGWGLPPPWRFLAISGGLLCLGVGLWLVVQTIRLFAIKGHGTLAPWDPPCHLVVQGIYRYVRNPMISGVIGVLLGESLIAGSGSLVIWCVLVTCINAVYIPLLEEPQLAARFGADYAAYQKNVPRWLPRLRPWIPPWMSEE
jgi:protein-S-isoprenylcysteine O-methyltransferase Ste14